MSEDLITIVLPTYNRREQLRKAIESVLSQNVAGVKIHIYDNCSEDGTEEMITGLMASEPGIVYIRRTSNIGALPNYVDALEQVKTPYYLPLADDDWLLEGSLQLLLDAIQKDPSLGAVVSQTRRQDESGAILGKNPNDDWEFRRYESTELMPLWVKRGHFEWSSILFRTAAKNAIGGPDIDTYIVWDVDFQNRFFSRYPVELIQHESAVYLMHPGQSSREEGIAKYKGMLKMVLNAKAGAKGVARADDWTRATRQFCDKYLLTIARNLGNSGSVADLLLILKKCIQHPQGSSCIPYLLSKWQKYKFRHWTGSLKSGPRGGSIV